MSTIVSNNSSQTELEEVRQFLHQLEPAQQQLLELFGEKRIALMSADSALLLQLSQREQTLSGRLRELLDVRRRILQKALKRRLPSDSLRNLVRAVSHPTDETLLKRISRAEERSAKLRQESWIHWIISHRAFAYYTGLLDIIAHRGEKSPTYGRGPNRETAGGAILDTTV